MLIVLLFLIELCIYNEPEYPLQIKDKEDFSEPLLGTTNNCGGMMCLERVDIKTGWGVYSNYLAFFGIPIIFLGTYLAQEIGTGTWRQRSYKILCQVKTPIREIYHFYIMKIGGLIVFVSILYGIYWLGTKIGFWS